jgi:hypothetical protein
VLPRSVALRRAQRESQVTVDVDVERLSRIENAVEAPAGQVEQLASGQDFLDRVLTAKLGHLPGSAEPR